jgi:chromosome segregation ATPase
LNITNKTKRTFGRKLPNLRIKCIKLGSDFKKLTVISRTEIYFIFALQSRLEHDTLTDSITQLQFRVESAERETDSEKRHHAKAMEKFTEEKSEFKEEISKLEKKLEKLEEELTEQRNEDDKKIEKLTEKKTGLKEEIAKLEAELELERERHAEARVKIEQMEKEVDEANERMGSETSELIARNTELQGEIDGLQANLDQATEQAVRLEELNQELQSLQQERDHITTLNEELISRAAELDEEIERLQAELSQAKEDASTIAEIEELQSIIAQLEQERDQTVSANEELIVRVAELEEKSEALQVTLDDNSKLNEQELAIVQEELQAQKARNTEVTCTSIRYVIFVGYFNLTTVAQLEGEAEEMSTQLEELKVKTNLRRIVTKGVYLK